MLHTNNTMFTNYDDFNFQKPEETKVSSSSFNSSESKVSSVGERVLGLIGKAIIAPTRLIEPLRSMLKVKSILEEKGVAGAIGHVLKRVALGTALIAIGFATCVTCLIFLPLYGVGRAGQGVWNRLHRESSSTKEDSV